MLKCGFYEKDITPPLGANIPGYFVQRKAEGVKEELFSKALALEVDGTCAIVISVDAVLMAQEVHDTAVARIFKATGIPSDRILISATHAHTGGPVKKEADPPFYEPDGEYFAMLGRMVGDSGILAFQRLRPATTRFAREELYGVSYIRNYMMKDGSVRTNPGWGNPGIDRPMSKIDPEFSAMFFYDETDQPIGLLANFAMHHDCVGGNQYSGDYSGYMAQELKKNFGQGFVTVFLNGACGNINHADMTKSAEEFAREATYEKIGRKLADEVVKLYKDAEPFAIDRIAGKKEVLFIPRRSVSDEEVQATRELVATIPMEGLVFSMNEPESPKYKRAKGERLLAFIELPEKLPVSVQAMRLGACMLYALSGEVYTEFGQYIKAHSPCSCNMVAELANGGESCYIPTPEAFGTEIYEAQIPSSRLIPEAGENMAKHALSLAQELF